MSSLHPQRVSFFADPVEGLTNAAMTVRLSLWWLRCTRWEAASRFLYGFVVPVNGQPSGSWSSYDVDDESFGDEVGGTFRLRIVRRHLTVAAADAHHLLTKVTAGETLAAACLAIGADQPDIHADKPLLDSKWARLSPIFLPTSPSQALLTPAARGRGSLTDLAGCVCTRYCPAERLLFAKDLPQADEVIRWAAAKLHEETGVDFSTAGDALGTLEIFGFPSLDERNRSRVRVGYQKGMDESPSTVSLRIEGADDGAEYLAGVRSELLNDVTSDQVLIVDGITGKAEIEIPEPVDGLVVRVWRKELSGRWMLWHEQEMHFIREIHAQLNMMGLSGTVGAPWLQSLDGTRARSRARAFSSISQVNMDQPMIMSSRAAWEKGIQTAREALRRIHPEQSQARFFEKGWEGDQKLGFAEWLKEKLSNHRGNVVLADPYFDLPGLDLVARASGAAEEIVVLTCTQLQSDDNAAEELDRAARLSQAAKDLLPILRGLRLRIVDLRSKRGGKKPLFHDRYLLFYSVKGAIETGFNLSTSLQSATLTSPLLITPIPSDVLDTVSDYVGGLLHPEKNKVEAEAITLFPIVGARSNHNQFGLSSYRARAVLHLVEVLQNRKGLVDPDEHSILQGLGYLVSEEDEKKVQVPSTPEQLVRVQTFLETASLNEAAVVWDGLVEASLNGWHDGIPQLLDAICRDRAHAIATFLLNYLLGHAKGQLRAEHAEEHTRTLAHVFQTPFSKAVENADNLYDYHHEFPLGTSWPIHCAIACLIEYFVGSVDFLVEQGIALADRSHAILSVLAGSLTSAARKGTDDLFDGFAESRTAFVRAISAIARWHAVEKNIDAWHSFESLLQKYQPNERQEILSRALYDLRIKANQAKARGIDEPQPLRQMIVDALLGCLIDGVSVERILELLPNFSGPTTGSWALSSQNEILGPLVLAKRLGPGDPFEVWNKVLTDRMKSHFFAATDAELVQVWGATFWNATDTRRTVTLDHLKGALVRNWRTLREPFLESRNYDRWRAGADAVLWAMLRVWSIRQQRPAEGTSTALDELVSQVVRAVEDESLINSAIGELKEVSVQVLARLKVNAP